MAYLAPMELQTQIEKLEARIAALEKMLHGGDATFDTIICKAWRVVDKDGTGRIIAGTSPEGRSGVVWVVWFDKDGNGPYPLTSLSVPFADGKINRNRKT